MQEPPIEITPEELAAQLESGEPPLLVDVREGWEFEIGHIAGSVNLPMGSLPARAGSVDPTARLVTICHHGVRSLNSALFFRSRGWKDARSLAGGVDLWATTVAPTMRRY